LAVEGLPLMCQTRDRFTLAWMLVIAGAALHQGDVREARDLFAESLALWQEMGNPAGYVTSLAGLAGVAATEGQADRAGWLFGAADALFLAGRVLIDGSNRDAFEQRVAAARACLDATTFAAAWTAGQAMTLEQASAEALGGAQAGENTAP
jgi:hypothetical protein